LATCLALLKGPLDHKVMPYWTTTDSFDLHILHVEQLTEVDPVGGKLTAAPFVIPESINVKDIEGLAIFDCATKMVSSKYGFQVPAKGIQCLKEGNILCIQGWCDDVPVETEYQSDCAILDDPCALYKELRCCLFKLCKEAQKVSVAFRDRKVTYAPTSDSDKRRLELMMLEAKQDCDALNCEQNFSRGRRMRHSCARSCGCG